MGRALTATLLTLLAVLTLAGALEANVKIEKTAFFDQPNCYKLSNGVVDVIVTTDIGPRVMCYRFVGGQNMLAETKPENYDPKQWFIRGGHRLWHAPEQEPRTYSPDNDPVEATVREDAVRLLQKVEPDTHIQKEMDVSLASSGSEVTITHTLTNRGLWAIQLAPWALTVVRGGGEEYIPNEPFIQHGEKLLPARPLVLWNYTDLSDSRLTLGKRLMRLRTDSKIDQATKIGVLNTAGWSAYLLDGSLFVKRYGYAPAATYTDMGCNYETFTRADFMEMESLGAFVTLQPGESAKHVEHWYLFKGVRVPADDAEADGVLSTYIKQTHDVK